MDVVRDKPDITWQEQRDSDLQSSVKFWMALVHRWYSGCSLCVSIAALGSMDRIFTMFAHLFAGRSPVTIRKRGYSVMRICDYLEGIGGVFPCSEASFCDFLCSEQQNNAPQSRMKGYMQAMNFVQHVMSMNEVSDLTSSARCKGACLGEYLKERVQASPLTVSELRRVHHLLQSSDDLWLRLFCGAVLMATYCRARWGDLMRAESVRGQRQYRHAMLLGSSNRTAQNYETPDAQAPILPTVAPTRGVDSTNWGIVWLHVRKELGIAPLKECAAWLRKIVGIPADNPERSISSHSSKSTMLSYAAKRGIDIPERLQLGYHTSNFQMGMVYSRDGAAASILILEKLIREIASGVFNPDETRSGRLLEPQPIDAPAGEPIIIEVKDEPEVVDESEPEELDSSEEPRPDFVKPTPIFQPTRAPDGFNLWQHSKLKTLHLMATENARVFACGRTAGALHVMLKDAPLFDTPLCTNCFHRPLE
eukprot:s800_g14.t1